MDDREKYAGCYVVGCKGKERKKKGCFCLLGALHFGHEPLVPMVPDNAGHQEMVLGAQTGHCIFQELRRVYGPVDRAPQLVEQGLFHVPAEFLLDGPLR